MSLPPPVSSVPPPMYYIWPRLPPCQQKFHKITQAYYRGSHGIVLVYDMSDPKTLDNTAYWMRSIRDTAGSNRVQICLVGNKVRHRREAL